MKKLLFAFLMWLPTVALAQFPTETATTTQASAFDEARQIAQVVKARASEIRGEMAVGSVSIERILAHADQVKRQGDRLDALKTIPGLNQWARDQLDDQTINLPAEFTAMRNAMDAYVAEVVSSAPTGAGGCRLLPLRLEHS